MDRAQRERQHRDNLERIQRVQLLAGCGDGAHVDHEGTLFERVRLMSEEMSSHQATELGLQALDRLLRRAETRDAPHARDAIVFLTALRDNVPLPLKVLRGLDAALGDDMLAVLDAWRHARLDLLEHVRGGPRRVGRALDARKLARA